MKPLIVIDKKQVRNLNTDLGRLQQLFEEICKAESAGVAGLEAHKQQCLDLQERIKMLKATYAPHEA